MTDQLTTGDLELAIKNADHSDSESLRKVLLQLVASRIIVLMDKPWDGVARPQDGIRMMFVSDGPNSEQPMLAVFTGLGFTDKFIADDNPFSHAVEVDARFAIVGLSAGAGIIINPNAIPSFRVDPALAKILQDSAREQLSHLKQASN
ncbi:MAG TPA: SseB family protein [Gammaproteobacteria bacterium]|nr:SseB family protein [Gammaproteobacteria bacterium]